MQLDSLRIIVTGAASGLGRHFATRLADAGARVLAVDLDEESLRELESYEAGEIDVYVADISREEEVQAMVERGVERFGSLNGLVNNAGIFRDALLVSRDRRTGEISRMSLPHWQKVLDVDLTGPFLCTRELVEQMLNHEVESGVVVNISSISRHGNRGQSNYSAAKAGLVAVTKVWGEELARYGVRTGAVAPGFVQTPILEGMRPEILEKLTANVPLQRVGTPEEIWMAVKFILECDYFTGRCIDVDGGLTL